MLPDRIDQLVESVLPHEQMQEMLAYVARGRCFSSFSVEALTRAWVSAVTAVAFGDDDQLDDWTDLGAELELRNLARPERLVPPAAMAALRRRIAQSTPEHFEAVAKHVRRVRRRLAREPRH